MCHAIDHKRKHPSPFWPPADAEGEVVPQNTFRFGTALALEGEVRINIGWCIPAEMQQSGRVPATARKTVSWESGHRTARSQSQLLAAV
jgi:hypothetical protein